MASRAAPSADPVEARCLSVVMPCFNEAATVRAAVERVLLSPYTAELILVDDGSHDASVENARAVEGHRLVVIERAAMVARVSRYARGSRSAHHRS